MFQASDYKERNFLNLNNEKEEHIHSIYLKEGTWPKYYSLSNSLCICLTRVITNHSHIGEYRLKFFPKEFIACPYSNYPIETGRYILFNCLYYTKY